MNRAIVALIIACLTLCLTGCGHHKKDKDVDIKVNDEGDAQTVKVKKK